VQVLLLEHLVLYLGVKTTISIIIGYIQCQVHQQSIYLILAELIEIEAILASLVFPSSHKPRLRILNQRPFNLIIQPSKCIQVRGASYHGFIYQSFTQCYLVLLEIESKLPIEGLRQRLKQL